MRELQKEIFERWLDAEAHGAAADEASERHAERALFEVFRFLPGLEPAPGFSARVVRRLEESPVVGMSRRPIRWFPWAASLGLLVSGIFFLQAMGGAKVLWRGLQDSGPASLLAGGASAFGSWLKSSIKIWESLAQFGRALAQVVQTPQVASGLALALLVSIVAFRVLAELAKSQRSWTYVDSI